MNFLQEEKQVTRLLNSSLGINFCNSCKKDEPTHPEAPVT